MLHLPPGRPLLRAQEVLLPIAFLQWRGGPESGLMPAGRCPQAPPPPLGALVSFLMFPTSRVSYSI